MFYCVYNEEVKNRLLSGKRRLVVTIVRLKRSAMIYLRLNSMWLFAVHLRMRNAYDGFHSGWLGKRKKQYNGTDIIGHLR